MSTLRQLIRHSNHKVLALHDRRDAPQLQYANRPPAYSNFIPVKVRRNDALPALSRHRHLNSAPCYQPLQLRPGNPADNGYDSTLSRKTRFEHLAFLAFCQRDNLRQKQNKPQNHWKGHWRGRTPQNAPGRPTSNYKLCAWRRRRVQRMIRTIVKGKIERSAVLLEVGRKPAGCTAKIYSSTNYSR